MKNRSKGFNWFFSFIVWYGMIQSKIIKDKHVRFFDEFAGDDYDKADIEDMFEKSEYLEIFGEAFPDHKGIAVSDLDDKLKACHASDHSREPFLTEPFLNGP